MAETKVVKNKSSGYGYKYSNLADLAREGITIDKMRVKPTEFGDYIEYFDGNEWHIGAKIVPFEAKGMNAAQAYGAALTYARRYTVQMAQSIACDDDDAVEQAKPIAKPKMASNDAKPTEKQLWLLKKLLGEAGKSDEEIERIASKCETAAMASGWIKKLQEDK